MCFAHYGSLGRASQMAYCGPGVLNGTRRGQKCPVCRIVTNECHASHLNNLYCCKCYCGKYYAPGSPWGAPGDKSIIFKDFTVKNCWQAEKVVGSILCPLLCAHGATAPPTRGHPLCTLLFLKLQSLQCFTLFKFQVRKIWRHDKAFCSSTKINFILFGGTEPQLCLGTNFQMRAANNFNSLALLSCCVNSFFVFLFLVQKMSTSFSSSDTFT